MHHPAKPGSMLPLLLALALALALAGCTQTAGEPGTVEPAPPPANDDVGLDQPLEEIPPATAPAATAPAATAGPARLDGYAGMRFGMSEDEARSAMDGGLRDMPGGDPGNPPGDACHYLELAGETAQPGLAFMFEGGRFVRYDVGNDTGVAPGGGRRGMSDGEIRALYPDRVEARPHQYTDGQYLRVEDRRGEGVLVFETDASGEVTAWRAGLVPQVDYIEGCS